MLVSVSLFLSAVAVMKANPSSSSCLSAVITQIELVFDRIICAQFFHSRSLSSLSLSFSLSQLSLLYQPLLFTTSPLFLLSLSLIISRYSLIHLFMFFPLGKTCQSGECRLMRVFTTNDSGVVCLCADAVMCCWSGLTERLADTLGEVLFSQ